MIVSIDIGHGWTKGIGLHEWRQPSVIGESRNLFEQNIKPDDVQYIDGEKHYFVGNLTRHSLASYFSTAENKTENWTTTILLKSVLGVIAPNEPIELITGLPVNAYFEQKTEFETLINNINGSHFDIMQGREKTACHIWIKKFKIVPQPLGSAMNFLLDEKGQLKESEAAEGRILIIDIGYFTCDILALNGMEIGKESYTPRGLGIDTAYKFILDELKGRISRNELDRAILQGKQVEARNRAFKALGNLISMEISSLNKSYDRYILTGGWAQQLADFINIPKAKTIIYDGMGNVHGYHKIGVRLWGASDCARAKTTTLSRA